MEKDFIPNDRALKLEKLGFDEPCFGFYDDGYLNIVNIRNGNMFKTNNGCLAPTFSQAFRWFREEHEEYMVLVPTCFGQWWIKKSAGQKYGDKYDTYEEAELACLDKLIEIVGRIQTKD